MVLSGRQKTLTKLTAFVIFDCQSEPGIRVSRGFRRRFRLRPRSAKKQKQVAVDAIKENDTQLRAALMDRRSGLGQPGGLETFRRIELRDAHPDQ